MATLEETAAGICNKLDDINGWMVKLGAQRDALLLSNQALTDRLKRIEILSAQAINAKPEDLKGMWLRVGQVAKSTDG